MNAATTATPPAPTPAPSTTRPSPTIAVTQTPAANTTRRNVAIAILVLVAAILGIRALLHSYYIVETDDAFVDGNIMPISARIAGHIADVKVVEGQRVRAGDILVTIDPRDYQAAYDQAKASLNDARAQAAGSSINVPVTGITTHQALASSNAGVSSSAEGVSAAQHNKIAAIATVAQAQANAAKTDADLVRYADLLKHQNVSQQQYDQALAAARSNRAAVDAAEASEQATEQSIKQAQDKQLQAESDRRTAETGRELVAVAHTREQSAQAQVALREAQLRQAELNLSYTAILAPADGVIGQKHAQAGQNVSIGQDLMSVVPLGDVWVTANFKETQLRHMQSGQAVGIHVDTFGGREYRGHITYIGGASGDKYSLLPPENATGNYVKVVQRIPVRIDFDSQENEDLLLRPGMSVVPEVHIR